MNSGQRIGLLVAALAALAVAFFVLSPGETKDDTSSTTTPQTSTSSVTTTVPVAPPRPAFTTIRVRGGKPVGGVRRIQATSGERVRIEVRSADTTDEVHLHGYDIMRDLTAGGRARFSFKADAEGIFELELEGSHTLLAKIAVRPG